MNNPKAAPIFGEYSDIGIKMQHDGLRQSLADQLAGREQYGIGDYPDWATTRNALESEMTKRNIPFDPAIFPGED